MDIVLASRNKHKITELRDILHKLVSSDINILSLDDIGFSGDIDETGTTFEENAKIKASVPASLGYIGLADDSGLETDALGGAPGVYSARYAGEHGDDVQNNEKLLRELGDTPAKDRTGRYVCVICLVTPNGETISARGECDGKILFEPRGKGGFGYDPLFFNEELGKTFAELTPEEKNLISHRRRAMDKFAIELKKKFDL